MFDETNELFVALLDLFSSWEQELEQARARAADLLTAGRSPERASPIADRQRRTRVIEAATTASVLRKCVEELGELLVQMDEKRVMAVHVPVPGVIHSPPLPGDGVAEPF